MTVEALRRRRARAQRLHAPRTTAGALVRHLLAVQAQDARAARLALRARGASAPTAGDALVVAWLARGTLHLVAREDHAWLLALTAPGRATANARRLAQEGVPPDAAERGVAAIVRALADAGPLDRAALAERVAAAGVATGGQALPHLLMRAALGGRVVRDLDGLHHLVPAPPPVDRDAALAALALRYLAAHGPAGEDDLCHWSGLARRDVRAGLRAIGPRELGGLLDLPRARRSARPVPPRRLPAFDPYLLGWRDRSFAVAPEHARRVHPGGGIVRAVATVDGRVVGTWTAPGGRVRLELFEPVSDADVAALSG